MVSRCIKPYWDVLSHLDTIIVYFPTTYHYHWTVTQLCGLPCHLVFIVRNIRLQLPHYAFFLLIKADVTALIVHTKEQPCRLTASARQDADNLWERLTSSAFGLTLTICMWLTLLFWRMLAVMLCLRVVDNECMSKCRRYFMIIECQVSMICIMMFQHNWLL